MKPEGRLRLRRISVLSSRIIAGSAFAIAAWAKAVDPWGSVYKLNEYFTVWNLDVPHEITVTLAGTLSCVEFLIGILLLSGSLRRTAAILLTAMMAFMLPLTAWIYIADPVADCGCFGDFLPISNGLTFLKNIILSLIAGYLLLYNRSVRGLFAMPVQWMVVAVSLAFPIYLNITGYNIQPLVDFRPYPTGSRIIDSESNDADDSILYIYERDGKRSAFPLDALPDSTWTFIDVSGNAAKSESIEVLDEFGDNILPDIIEEHRPQLLLVISDPELHFLRRSHYVNRLYEYLSRYGVAMTGLIGADGETFEKWKSLTRPHFDVYPAEDTALKQLARGEAAVVYLREGRIVWKRTLQSLDARLPYGDSDASCALDSITAVDNGFYHWISAGIYILSLSTIYLLSLSPKILNLFKPEKSQKKS